MTFLGYDFTQARFIGSVGFTEPEKIQSTYLPALNDLIVNEEKKFSIREAFRIKSGNYNTSIKHNKEVNSTIDVKSIIIDEEYSLDKNTLQNVISNYDFGDLKGIGISYIVESLDKTKNKAFVYITFIDLETKTLLHAEKADGQARGFGWRNFWAGAMYQINKKVGKEYYKKISNQYK